MIMFQLNDLNPFFMKYVYMIPPPHYFCQVRVWVVGLICFNVAKEYYDFMQFGFKFRTNSLLFMAVLALEIAVVATHGKRNPLTI